MRYLNIHQNKRINPSEKSQTITTQPKHKHHRKEMQAKTKSLLANTFILGTFAFIVILSTGIRVLWISASLATLWTSLLITILYTNYRHQHASIKEKKRRNQQQPIRSHFDNIWYRPADSTLLEHEQKKLKRKKI
jgi:hypothetical protein